MCWVVWGTMANEKHKRGFTNQKKLQGTLDGRGEEQRKTNNEMIK